MKNTIKKNKRIIIATISIFIFVIILSDIYKYEITSYDNWAYNVFVENLRSENTTLIMKLVTSFGSGLVLISIVLIMFLLYKKKKDTIYASINLILIYIINNIIKLIVQRPRPSGYNIITENSYSFPSGHSIVSTAFYGFIIVLIYKNIKDNKKKYLYMTLLFLLIILICISRIYLGVHYLSDTLGGFFFAVAYLMVYITVLNKIIGNGEKNEIKKN